MEVWFIHVEYRRTSDSEALVFRTVEGFNAECERLGKEICDENEIEEIGEYAMEYAEEAWLFEAQEKGVIYYRTGATTVRD